MNIPLWYYKISRDFFQTVVTLKIWNNISELFVLCYINICWFLTLNRSLKQSWSCITMLSVIWKTLVPCIICCCSVDKSCPTLLRPHGLQPVKLLCLRDFPGKNTGMGCHFLLQGIFLTQGSNPCLLPCRWILYPELLGKHCVMSNF